MQNFNPELHAALVAGTQWAPSAKDGLTHLCVVREDLTAPLCGNVHGTRLHNHWLFVDCPDCRVMGAQ